MSRRVSSAAKVATPGSSTVDTPGPLPDRTLVVDNGAYSIKAGFASTGTNTNTSISPTVQDCNTIPNCLARSSRDNKTYIGSQLHTCVDYGEMQFKRPVQKGYIVNWPTQASIWENEFLSSPSSISTGSSDSNAQQLHCDPHETNLIMTEAPNAPTALSTNTDQIIFEEFEFASAWRTTPAVLNTWTDTASLFGDTTTASGLATPAEALFVIDSGHSHTTLTPLLRGQPIHTASKRLSVGGKTLSNYLSELISLRHFSLIDEPYIVDQIKEDALFVSADFHRDLESTWKGGLSDEGRRGGGERDTSIVVDYVLPDYESLHRGYMRPHDSSHRAKLARLGLKPGAGAGAAASASATGAGVGAAKEEAFPLSNERFTVPELLFSPTDIGMRESGIAQTLMQCLALLPRQLWQAFLGNILVVGGNTLIRGFVERVESEVRALAPQEFAVRVRRPEDPIKNTWLGGARLAARRDVVKNVLVTRQEYLEYGQGWVARQFATRKPVNK